MYQFPYAEVLDDAPKAARERERKALEHCINLLRSAQKQGSGSRESIEALVFARRLWSAFIEDLANTENDLPKALRADLISIGLWVMREADDIRLGKSDKFGDLIDVCEVIAEGLK